MKRRGRKHRKIPHLANLIRRLREGEPGDDVPCTQCTWAQQCHHEHLACERYARLVRTSGGHNESRPRTEVDERVPCASIYHEIFIDPLRREAARIEQIPVRERSDEDHDGLRHCHTSEQWERIGREARRWSEGDITAQGEQPMTKARSRVEQALGHTAQLGNEGVVIGNEALRQLGVERAWSDLDILWTGGEDAMRGAVEAAFGHSAWTAGKGDRGRRMLRADATESLCAVQVLVPDAWRFTLSGAEWQIGHGGVRFAPRESLAAMKLALLEEHERTSDIDDLNKLEDYGTNAEDAALELVENLGDSVARKALERTLRMWRGMHWQRGLQIVLKEPRHEHEGECNWRIHPNQCSRRHTLRHVLREDTRYANGSFRSQIVADYANVLGAENAAARSAPERSMERSAFYGY